MNSWMELPTQLEGVSKNAAKNIYIIMGNFPSCLSSIAHADKWTYRLMDIRNIRTGATVTWRNAEFSDVDTSIHILAQTIATRPVLVPQNRLSSKIHFKK